MSRCLVAALLAVFWSLYVFADIHPVAEAGDSPVESTLDSEGRHPRGVAIHAGRGLAVIVNEQSAEVAVMSLPSGQIIARIPVGKGPWDVAIDPGRDLAVVTLAKDDRIALIDLSGTPRLIATVPAGRAPHGVAIDAASGIAAIANRKDNALVLFELDTRTITDEIAAGRQPRIVAMQGEERRLWVAIEQENAVRILDLEARAWLATIPAGKSPSGIAISTQRRLAVIASEIDNELRLIDIDSLVEVGRVATGHHPRAVAIDEASGRIYAVNHQGNSVSVIALESLATIGTLATGRHPEVIAIDAVARIAVVTNRTDNSVTLLPLPDTVAPVITVDFPHDHLLTNQPELWLTGSVSEPAGLDIGGEPVVTDQALRFEHAYTLAEGVNAIRLVAVDRAGNSGVIELTVTLDTQTPGLPDTGRMDIGMPLEGQVTVTGEGGSVEPDSLVRITNQRSGDSVTVIADVGGAFIAVLAGQAGDAYVIAQTDAAGNAGDTVVVTTDVPPDALPPDPQTIAPAYLPSATALLGEAIAFLYQGANPVQRGVDAGAIDPVRVAVLRGRVLDRDGAPLPGVTVTIHDQPQFGHTLSRADGLFDLAVNGGGRVIVNFDKPGYLPAQRVVETPWQDFAPAPDVVLLEPDGEVTTVDLSGATALLQVARGSVVSDADGSRRATLMFPAGTRAELVLPDGDVQTLATLHVRATEYTVGGQGPAAMPGTLPPGSAYTYAVEYSVDEAIAAGAREVRFDRPVTAYVENFMDFPVGGAVPAGWYDRARAAWIPAPNGRVIRVLSVNAGLAMLDIDGSGAPAGIEALAVLGIDDDERRALAELYPAGQGLWRVAVDHFTPWDFNWPYGPPADARPPAMQAPVADEGVDDPDCRRGSVIECENQILRMSLPVAGTSYRLVYASDRVAGRRSAYTLDIALSGPVVPASLRRIELEVSVAGRRFTERFPPATGLQHRFSWDGRDVYGRAWPGSAVATIRIGYVYRPVYYEPAELERSFAALSGVPMSAVARDELILWQEATAVIGVPDARVHGLGGWTFDIHHAYDPVAARLHYGDGSRSGISGVRDVITTVAGNGDADFSGDGGPARLAAINEPTGIAVGPDGSVYISDRNNCRIRRVGPDGIITTMAGTGECGFSGDGGLAVEAGLRDPFDVALGPDGSVYFADAGNNRVRRIRPDGIIETVAGNGSFEFSSDGGPATEAGVVPEGIAVAADGSIYIADVGNARIRRVDPDGIITTIAGTGVNGLSGDGGPATLARMTSPAHVEIAPDGSLYITDMANHRIRRISLDGIIRTVAGSGPGGIGLGGFSGDGRLATQARLRQPSGVAFGRDGSLYIADTQNFRIRRVGMDGVIETFAGGGMLFDDGTPVSIVGLMPFRVATGPDGSLYYIESGGANRIRRIGPALPRLGHHDHALASADAREVHVFSPAGRHLETRDALTGALRLAFTHDDVGRLIAIDDGDGNRTLIERDAAGDPVAIVAPAGQRTALSIDGGGYLAMAVAPDGATHRLTHDAQGLLEAVFDPRGHAATYAYTPDGRLTMTADAADGGWQLLRADREAGHEVEMTSAAGRVSRYFVDQLPDGVQRRERRLADGATDILMIDRHGGRVHTLANGVAVTTVIAPDPRFSVNAPVPASTTVATPAGRVNVTRVERRVDDSSFEEVVIHNGRRYSTRHDAAAGTLTGVTAEGRTLVTHFDVQGRVAAQALPGLAAIAYHYDDHGRLVALANGTDADDARVYGFGYDDNGHLASMSDPAGRVSRYEYDTSGRLTRRHLPDDRVIDYMYDPNGNTIAILPPGRDAHVFTYNAVDLEQGYTAPGLPGIATDSRHDYNEDRQLTQVERPDGGILALAYDDGGRLESLSSAHGQYRYSYLPATGQLSRITAPDGGTLDYDWDGHLPLAEMTNGEVSGMVSYDYDDNFWPVRIAVDDESIELGHDDDGLPVSAGALELIRDGDSGLPAGTRLGRITTSISYNAFAEPVAHTVHHDDAPIAGFSYVRDDLGRITVRSETIDGVSVVDSYDYDLAGRLTGMTRNGVTTTWGYDPNGNRIRHNGAVIATHDAQDRLLTYDGVGYGYTANGELASRVEAGATTAYDYDAFGNLRRVMLPGEVVIDYVIDGRNRRIGKKIDGVLVQAFLYQDQLNPVVELDGAGNVVSRFVYADQPNVPAYMIREGATFRILSDHLGSPRLVINADDGTITQRIDYDVWGNIISDTNPGFQPFGFAGGLHDPHTGLVRFGARDYDPRTARWTTRDPIGFSGGDTNLFAYVSNDPVNFIDPDGELLVNVIGGILGGMAGGSLAVSTGQSFTAGIVSGAISGFFVGGGVLFNAITGAVSGVTGYYLDRRQCDASLLDAAIAGAVGVTSGVIGRQIGLVNALSVARSGQGGGRMLGTNAALMSGYYAQAVGGSFVSGGLSATMR